MLRTDSCLRILEAAHAIGLDCGAKALAPVLGTSPAITANRLNPNNDDHFLRLEDAIAITEHTDDDRILATWARQRGYVLHEAPLQAHGREQVFHVAMQATGQHGQLAQLLEEVLEDNRITPREAQALAEQVQRLQKRLSQLALKAGPIN